MVTINPNERVDDLQNGYFVIQNPQMFCFGIDAVLLASFVKVKSKETVLDLGTGTAIIPILLAAKTKATKIIGLEIQKESVQMAQRSIFLNNLQDKVGVHEGDIKEAVSLYKASSIDVITSNPPYINHGAGILNDYSPKAIARHEILCSLEDIIRSASKLLKYGGRFYMIHRPYRVVDIFSTMCSYNIEPKLLRFVQPYEDKEPNMVLVEGIRSAKPLLKVLPPLIIYKKNGEYTDELMSLYSISKKD